MTKAFKDCPIICHIIGEVIILEKKLDRRINRSKRVLKDAFISLLEKKNFEEISVTDIVQLADLNRSTFYSHFQDKESLMISIMDELLDGIVDSIHLIPSNLACDKDQDFPTSSSMLHLLTYVSDHSFFLKVMMNTDRTPQFMMRLSHILYEFYYSELDVHPIGIDDKKVNRGFVANYIASVVVGFIYHWVVSTNLKYSPDYLAGELTKILTLRLDIPFLLPKS